MAHGAVRVSDAPRGAAQRATRERWQRAQLAERGYARHLRQIARVVGGIVEQILPGGAIDPNAQGHLREALERYAAAIAPWARAVGGRMLAEVARRDKAAWFAHSRAMGQGLRKEIQEAPTGELLQFMLSEQVELITSLPRKAAERVHKLTLEGVAEGTRAAEIAEMIRASGKVTESRAKLIARTEVARTASALTIARAVHIGVTHAYWRTSLDSDVRKSHKEMEGKIVDLRNPPILSDGTRTLPGMIYNCRCYPEPILPDDLLSL